MKKSPGAKRATPKTAEVIPLQGFAERKALEASQDAVIKAVGEFILREFPGRTPNEHGVIGTLAIGRIDLFKDLVELRDDGRLEDWMILGIAAQYFTDYVAPMMEARRAAEGERGIEQ